MGYDLHITRAEFWAENEGQAISAEEWLKIVSDDDSLSLDHANGRCFAVYTAEAGDDSRWLDWHDGNVYAKNPDRRTLEKMLAVADALGGRVQGDDGEHYKSVDDLPEVVTASMSKDGGSDELPLYMQDERRTNRIMYALIALALLAAFIVRQFS